MNVECTEFKYTSQQFLFFQVMGGQLEKRLRISSVSCTLTYKQGYPNTKRKSNSPPQPLSNYSSNNLGPIPNMGIYNTDRGHLVALEFGGPELKENLVPMWSRFNKHGDWKKLEEYIKGLIFLHTQVTLNITCNYSDNDFDDKRIPLSFDIEVQWKDDSNSLHKTIHTLQHPRPYAERYISNNNMCIYTGQHLVKPRGPTPTVWGLGIGHWGLHERYYIYIYIYMYISILVLYIYNIACIIYIV